MTFTDRVFDDIDPDCRYFNEIYNSINENNQSNYYTIDSYNNKFESLQSGNLSVWAFNIRSFYKNADSFLAVLKGLVNAPDIIILSETWLTEVNKDCAIIDGYVAHHTVRSIGRSGGVSVFTRDTLDANYCDSLCLSNGDIETCTVRVKGCGSGELFIVGIYRPHSGTPATFSDALSGILGCPILSNKKVFLLGDYNINLMDSESPLVSQFVDVMHSFHFLPVITRPTRFSDNASSSLIDNIFLNFTDAYTSGILLCDITDHCLVFLNVLCGNRSEANDFVKVTFRLQNDDTVQRFRDALIDVNWEFSADVDMAVAEFESKLNALYCQCFPLKVKRLSVKRISKPWLTSGILKSIKTKSKYYKLYKLGLITREANNEFRNQLNITIRKSKRNYYHRSFKDNDRNAKKSWTIINRLLERNKSRKTIKDLLINNELICNDGDIATAFSDYFSTIADELDSRIPADNREVPIEYIAPTPQSFYLFPTSPNECSSLIYGLKNKGNGIDTVSVRVLKCVRDVLAIPVSMLVNLSFSLGVFPSSLKVATITPVFKSGDSQNVTNYRPISVLPTLSKVFERSMANRIQSYLKKFSIISADQFGFQEKLSTESALVSLTEYIYAGLNKKEHTLAVFLDLKKAFDTVNHRVLSSKLWLYGFRGLALGWLKSFLGDRKQIVRIGNSKSDVKTINIGVPQGSILGPILYLIYVNDLPHVLNNAHPVLFADDTVLLLSGADCDALVSDINAELDAVHGWLVTNRLTLNLDKTLYLIFTNSRSVDRRLALPVTMGGRLVKFEGTTKYLGVFIDSALNFRVQIDAIVAKLSKTAGVLHRIKHFVPKDILLRLYYSLAYPYFIYCNVVWGNTSDAHLSGLRLVQKRLIRIITDSDYLAHTEPLFAQAKILKYDDIHKFLIATRGFRKNESGQLLHFTHNYDTRSTDYALPQYQRLTKTQHSLSFVIPAVWNQLPATIKSCCTELKFKVLLKKYLLSLYGGEEPA